MATKKKAAPAPAKAPIKLTAANHAEIAACLNKSGKATVSVKEVAKTAVGKGGQKDIIIID